jgi:hypothetical protein
VPEPMQKKAKDAGFLMVLVVVGWAIFVPVTG